MDGERTRTSVSERRGSVAASLDANRVRRCDVHSPFAMLAGDLYRGAFERGSAPSRYGRLRSQCTAAPGDQPKL